MFMRSISCILIKKVLECIIEKYILPFVNNHRLRKREAGANMKNLKQNRIFSFTAIFIVYLLATAIGVAVYGMLSFDWWLSLLISDVVATVVTFIFSIIFSNASVYDPYWSVQPPVILITFALFHRPTPYTLLLIAVVSFWAVRLTANWAYTFGDLTHQDWRYSMLREKTGVFYPIINLVGIHLVPTLVVYGCILPGVYAVREGLAGNIFSVFLLLVSLSAAVMQGAADIQMHRFRRNKTAPFIRVGLWKYSRHPNYLGEILMWWGVGMSVVVASPNVPYLLAGAVANTLLFLAVSIPMADKRQSRKPGFDKYKSETRMLLPIKK